MKQTDSFVSVLRQISFFRSVRKRCFHTDRKYRDVSLTVLHQKQKGNCNFVKFLLPFGICPFLLP
jgi:hypothetical protein